MDSTIAVPELIAPGPSEFASHNEHDLPEDEDVTEVDECFLTELIGGIVDSGKWCPPSKRQPNDRAPLSRVEKIPLERRANFCRGPMRGVLQDVQPPASSPMLKCQVVHLPSSLVACA